MRKKLVVFTVALMNIAVIVSVFTVICSKVKTRRVVDDYVYEVLAEDYGFTIDKNKKGNNRDSKLHEVHNKCRTGSPLR